MGDFVVSKTRSTIEPKIGIGNSFFESKNKISYFNLIKGIPRIKNLIPRRSAQVKGFQGSSTRVSRYFREGRAF
jgi:hypothetical protein